MNFSFLSDKDFMRHMLSLAIPVAFQQFITAGLNMVDVLMVGQLGETAIAALGLANQIFFIYILLLFGITSGTAIFSAQFWGKDDIESIHKILGISLSVSVIAGVIFSLAATLMPETLLSFYTEDQEVIALGSSYLRIVGLSYIFTGIVTAYHAIYRSITLVKLTVSISVSALIIKSILGYMLIFGIAGMPALGVRGAAIATAFGWVFQFILIAALTYTLKTPLAVNPLTFFNFERAFFIKVMRTATPAAINEIFWAVGITTYNAVYARIGTGAIAAVQINATIEEISFVLFIGLGHACAIMIGNKIGAGEPEVAFEYSRRYLIMVIGIALIIGVIVLFARDPVIGLYNISADVAQNAYRLMTVLAFTAWLRSINFILFIGALRAGGDTKFAMYMEIFSIWTIGVPAALIGGFVLGLPVHGVYLMVLSEELIKAIIMFWRYLSRKWIHDLATVAST